jgi:DNA ligase D-like protein (predicted ligase)
VRALAFCDQKGVRIFSRNRLSFNSSYPEIVEKLRKQPRTNYILDGEIVAFEKGISSFAKLQQRMKSSVETYYFIFDILYLNGRDLRQMPLLKRKKELLDALVFNSQIRYVTHRAGNGIAYYEKACREGWEGVIAKRADSVYTGGRSRDWLKFKCSLQQEFVIVGYTDPEGHRAGFGALLIGFYGGDQLLYAGKVGTGYSFNTLLSLTEKMKALERKTPAVKGIGLPKKNVHWVEPKLVAQIAFSEWTDDAKLRHPSFLGLRDDKNPRDVIRESPDVTPETRPAGR